ncbi:MAG: hypothetical protein HQK77_00935 [Desulfobacterales bacterium]|nr:hypothetical protein [Desulfobacterales bacterium]
MSISLIIKASLCWILIYAVLLLLCQYAFKQSQSPIYIGAILKILIIIHNLILLYLILKGPSPVIMSDFLGIWSCLSIGYYVVDTFLQIMGKPSINDMGDSKRYSLIHHFTVVPVFVMVIHWSEFLLPFVWLRLPEISSLCKHIRVWALKNAETIPFQFRQQLNQFCLKLWLSIELITVLLLLAWLVFHFSIKALIVFALCLPLLFETWRLAADRNNSRS